MKLKFSFVSALVAFLMAASLTASAWRDGILLLPMALIPLTAGIGILRGRPSSAYGLALFQVAQGCLVLLFSQRSGSSMDFKQVAILLGMSLGPAVFFYLVGRDLERVTNRKADTFHLSPWIGLSILTFVPFLFLQAFAIPTASMENTLFTGKRMLVERFPTIHPQRGDIVVFTYPMDRKQTFNKRVVGLPGDRIRIVQKNLLVNGSPVPEPYVVHRTDYLDLYRDNFPSEPNTAIFPAAEEMLRKNVVNGEVAVPAGKYFVLGDNRDQSLDSRYWGFVDQTDLIGKPLLIYSSPKPDRLLKRL